VKEDWNPVARRVRVVLPVRLDPTGRAGPTPGQSRGAGWRRTSWGFFVPADVTADLPEQRIVEAAARLTTGAVTGWAALRLNGGGYFDGLDRDGRTLLPVDLALGEDRLRPHEGVALHRTHVPEDHVVIRYGVRCLAPEGALFDEMRWASHLDDRVVAMDMAAAAELTSIRRMAAYTRSAVHRPGRADVLWALRWADEHALSPQEVRLRMVWRQVAGWPAPLCNPTLVDLDGRFIGMPDLLDVESGVVGEFSGALHRQRARHRRDVARDGRFRAAGLEPFEVVGADLDDRELVVHRMGEARQRAGRHPRRWVVVPGGPSLDDRLDLRDHLRAMAEGDQRG
jgi:hypothetical protein